MVFIVPRKVRYHSNVTSTACPIDGPFCYRREDNVTLGTVSLYRSYRHIENKLVSTYMEFAKRTNGNTITMSITTVKAMVNGRR